MLRAVLDILTKLADYGISGVVIAAQLMFIMRQEKRLEEANKRYREECEARVNDAKAYTEMALDLQDRVTKSLGRLSDMLGGDQSMNGNTTYHGD
ncbi:MAG: hypothetical protein EBT03_12495 [Betaproteobacteria bacterium]|nr:hypothetical protein [Betaproteobacteria bacterium]